MIARLRRSLREDEGFTLVELLVVIIIIGILSAVAVPVYLNQQKKAKDSAANSDVSTLGKEIQAALVDKPAVSDITITSDGKRYSMTIGSGAAVDLGRVSDGVVLVSATGAKTDSVTPSKVSGSTDSGASVSTTNWCVAVAATEGSKKVYRYSAENGIEAGKSCDGTETFSF